MSVFREWIEHRIGLGAAMHEALYENIPGGSRWRFVTGSMLVFCFITQAVTGLFLWMGYSASSQTAWESVYFIQHEMTLGWFLRGIHHYMAQAMVVLLALHFFQVVVDGAYRAPREFNFWVGLVLALCVQGLALTGYLLPWDQKGYWATKVATNLMALTPAVGPEVQQVVVGGSDYGHFTLTRFFALHAGLLPAMIVVFLAIHIALFRRHGITAHSHPRRPDEFFWPRQVFKDGFAFFLLLVAVVGWTIYKHGAELTGPADPSEQYAAARPEWYFLFLFQLLKKVPEFIGAMVIPTAVLIYFFLMPFIGRVRVGHALNIGVMVLLLTAAGYLTIEAYLQDQFAQRHPAAPPASVQSDSIAVARHNEFYEASREFLEAKTQTEREFERLVELIDHRGGIPVQGAIELQRNDPETQGPRLFKRYCSSCHDYSDPEGRDPVHIVSRRFQAPEMEESDGAQKVKRDDSGAVVYADQPTGAPNLFGVGSREWLRGLLDPGRIDKIELGEPANPREDDPDSLRREIVEAPYFGNTAHREGEMARFVHDNLSQLDEEGKKVLENVIVAVSAQARLKSQAEDDAEAANDGRLASGIEAFSDGSMFGGSESCSDCHHFPDIDDPASAPDLEGWMSAEWLKGIISNPEHERFYGYTEGENDRMPAFAKNAENPEMNQLSPHDLEMLVRWLRHDDRELEDNPEASASP
jgi:ubiquinol-cytochrome c reductase cytochrome b subunit